MQHRRRRQAWVAIGASTVALGLIWRLVPAASPPLYDGVCIADRYRQLGGTPPPSSASTVYSGSPFPPAEVYTSETPAQAQIIMMAGTFTAAASITVSVTPVAAPAPPPGGKVQDGNAYRIAATAGGQQLQPASQDPVTIVLRGSGLSNSVILYVNAGSGWQPLRTFNLGCGFTFETVSQRLGYFALFRTPGSRSPSSNNGFTLGILVVVITLLVVVASIGVARVAAGRRQ